jgi:predicted nucleic acid-binding protein
MKVVFADTFYFFALVNPADPRHLQAKAFAQSYRQKVLTTNWVLVEVGDGLAHPGNRPTFLQILDTLRAAPNVRIVDLEGALFDEGVSFYRSRMDKGWTLTDCLWFAVMQREGVAEALTGDRHFEQPGFTAPLK